MATIDDLLNPNFKDLSDEQLNQLIRDVRARRRSPDPEIKAASVKKAVAKKKTGKAVALTDVSKLTDGLTPEQAAELMKMLRK